MNKTTLQTTANHSQEPVDRQVSGIRSSNTFRSRLAALSLAVSGILFVLYPAIRPFSDESSLQGALAFASPSWVLAHTLAMLKIAEGHAEVVRGAELVKGISTLHSKVDRVHDATRMLLRTSTARTALAMAAAYGFGLASYPLLMALLGWISREVAAKG